MAVGPSGFAAARISGRALDGPVFQFSRLVPDDALDWLHEGVAQAVIALDLSDEIVDILVLRPLAFGKLVVLPPVRAALLRPLVETNLEQLFPTRAETWTADAVPVEHHRLGPRRTVAASLPKALLDLIEAAVHEAGLRLGRMIPAPAGAAAYASELTRRGGCPVDGLLELALPDVTELVSLRDSQPVGLVPTAGQAEAMCEALVDSDLACRPRFGPTATGWRLALEICAIAGTRRRIAQPLSAGLLRRRRSLARRRSLLLAGATAAALVAGLGFRVLDMKRELTAVREARTAIAPGVEHALRQRQEITELRDLAAQIQAAQQAESRWPTLFADIAASMPETSYLTEVVGRPDSLVLWGTQGPDGWRPSSSLQVSHNSNAPSAGRFERLVSWKPKIPGTERQVQDAK